MFLISSWSCCDSSARGIKIKKKKRRNIHPLTYCTLYVFCGAQRCQSRLKANCTWSCKHMQWDGITDTNLNRRFRLGLLWGSWQIWILRTLNEVNIRDWCNKTANHSQVCDNRGRGIKEEKGSRWKLIKLSWASMLKDKEYEPGNKSTIK